MHKGSGRGNTKHDASTEDDLIEIKDANKTHSLSAEELHTLWSRAVAQDRDAVYVIYFTNGIVANISVTKQ